MENGPWQTPLVHSAVVASQRTLAWGSVATRDSALRASSELCSALGRDAMSGKAAGRSTTRKVGDADAGQKPTTRNPSAKHVGREVSGHAIVSLMA
jgi:hypothetical protein